MRTESDCVFFKIVAGEIPCFKLYEDDATLAFMDVNPANEGHALAISREHWENLAAIPPGLAGATIATARRIATALEITLAPDGINLVQANGQGAGQSVPHFHLHVLPRRLGDELALNWGMTPGDMDAIGTLAERVRAAVPGD